MHEDFEEIIIRFVVPIISLLVIFWAGILVQSLLDVPNIITIILVVILSVGFLAYYFRSEIGGFLNDD